MAARKNKERIHLLSSLFDYICDSIMVYLIALIKKINKTTLKAPICFYASNNNIFLLEFTLHCLLIYVFLTAFRI